MTSRWQFSTATSPCRHLGYFFQGENKQNPAPWYHLPGSMVMKAEAASWRIKDWVLLLFTYLAHHILDAPLQ